MIIDANNLILGRLGTYAAKKALLGEKIDIVNCESCVITGNRKKIFDNYDIKLNGDFLINKIFPNKRGKELMEFAGTIIGEIESSKLIITFVPLDDIPLTVDIIGKDNRIMLDETNEEIIVFKGKIDSSIKFNYPHVSNSTTKILLDILEKDGCLLPTLQNSYFAHKELFRIFNNHINPSE